MQSVDLRTTDRRTVSLTRAFLTDNVNPLIASAITFAPFYGEGQLHIKTTDLIFVRILPEMYLKTRSNWLNFKSFPDRIFLKHSSTLRDTAFSTIWLIYLQKNGRIFMKICHGCIFGQ